MVLRLDLNHPISLSREFDVVFNGDIDEHFFKVWQFYKIVHNHNNSGGLMIHGGQFTGWLDHCFLNSNPMERYYEHTPSHS